MRANEFITEFKKDVIYNGSTRIVVAINPTARELDHIGKNSKMKSLRGYYSDQNFYFWDGWDTIHAMAAADLGLEYEIEHRLNLVTTIQDGEKIWFLDHDDAMKDIYMNHPWIQNNFVTTGDGYMNFVIPVTGLTNESVITERILNLLKPEDKMKYISTLAPIMLKSYAGIGGYKHINTLPELTDELHRIAQKDGIWKLVRKDDEIVSATIYKKTNMGRKALMTGGIKDEEKKGRDGVYQVKGEDIAQGRMYAEVSDKMEYILITKFKGKPIPNKYAAIITGKEVQLHDDGFHYSRDLGGEIHTKILVGRLDQDAWEWVKNHESEDVKVIDKAA